ncbi:SseB family protein [Plantactinospora siamensis]|uniref:SseB family protein n=1 Tax=Plantactinospora siamensis TaxID=555372 RepID=A0ABV6NQD3_9ACTN
MTGWVPTTGPERAMLAAAEAGDRAALLAAVASGPLLLPVSSAAAAGREAPAWPTGVLDGITHVLAFTSPAAIAACLPDRSVSYRADSLAGLVAGWPDEGWLLAVDPGLPIGLRVTTDEVRAAPELARELETEVALRDAIRAEDPDALAAAVLRAGLAVPLRPGGSASRDLSDPDFPWWCLPDEAGGQAVPVFTSEARLRQVLGDHELVEVNALQLAGAWPDPAWQLALNPGTQLAAALPGESVLTLRDWLGEVETVLVEAFEEERAAEQAAPARPGWATGPAAADDPDDDPDPDLPVRLQIVIPHRYLPSYLDDNYDRAAGLVHAWGGPARDTPARLYRRLGLLGEGSPFQESDEWVAVLRWEPDDTTPAEWVSGEPRMEAVAVPDGCGLHVLHDDGRDEPLARYDAAARTWRPTDAG